MEPQLRPFDLGSSEEEAQHWLVLDREARTLSVLPVRGGRCPAPAAMGHQASPAAAAGGAGPDPACPGGCHREGRLARGVDGWRSRGAAEAGAGGAAGRAAHLAGPAERRQNKLTVLLVRAADGSQSHERCPCRRRAKMARYSKKSPGIILAVARVDCARVGSARLRGRRYVPTLPKLHLWLPRPPRAPAPAAVSTATRASHPHSRPGSRWFAPTRSTIASTPSIGPTA